MGGYRRFSAVAGYFVTAGERTTSFGLGVGAIDGGRDFWRVDVCLARNHVSDADHFLRRICNNRGYRSCLGNRYSELVISINGIMEIVSALRLRREINNKWLLILAGLGSVVFGGVILIWPGAGALALIWWIGTFSVFFGVMLIALAFRMRYSNALRSSIERASPRNLSPQS
jgi:hypothetical protein